MAQIEQKKNGISFDDMVIEKLGKYDLFDDYQKKYENDTIPSIQQFDQSFWAEKTAKSASKK